MKKLKTSVTAKVIALILYCVLSITLVASATGSVILESWGAYNTDSYEEIQINAIEGMAWSRVHSAGRMYLDGADPDSIFPNSNFRFAVFDAEGKELYSNKGEGKAILRVITTIEPRYYIDYSEGEAGSRDTLLTVVNQDTHETVQVKAGAEFEKWKADNSHEVVGYVLKDMEYHDEFYENLKLLDMIFPYNYGLLAVAVGSSVLLILLLAFFMVTAGHRRQSEEICLGLVDRIPLDVFLFLSICAIFSPVAIVSNSGINSNIISYIVVGLVTVWIAVSVLITLSSLAVRVKSITLWSNCLCVKVCLWCGKTIKKLILFAATLLKSLSMSKRFVLFAVLVLFVELFLMLLSGLDAAMSFFLWALNIAATLIFFAYIVFCFTKLRAGAKELGAGSLTCSIDTKFMRGEFLEHANDMMNIRSGLTRAVNERMKSERFQSELITNVSHDIKTPLTSIVNYVDLLEKEELNNENAKEYVEVLSRQSAKLKKLIGDLIEASKASTGVLAVNPEVCELGVLLDQCAGEYTERLHNAGLKLMVTKPEEDLRIMADGRHMWRILDNLMGNVLKYAQQGTRVYFSLDREDNKAVIGLRNISRDELNVSGEELMERFVRGDSSRSTEGSGLGLAIAKSLCEIQGGEMSLSVDGDLFKVILKFDIMA